LEPKKERIIVVMPPALLQEIRDRTEDSQRSINKEIVWIVQQFLKQEQATKKEPLQPAPSER